MCSQWEGNDIGETVYLGAHGSVLMPCVGSGRKGREIRKKRKREGGKHYNLSSWVN